MAPERGPLLGSTFDPPIYVPQLWGNIVWGVSFWPKNGTQIGDRPSAGRRQGPCHGLVE